MNDPKLYRHANKLQRRDAVEILAEFLPKLQWRKDGLDTILDVGSGSGDVLMELVYPQLPKPPQRIVCTDLSEKMVEGARMHFQHFANSEFKVLDIASHTDLPLDLKGQFDHVTSFYCLQLVNDHRQFFQNIYNILRPEGGDCLITSALIPYHIAANKCLSKHPKWSSYMQDIDRFVPPCSNVEDIEKHTLHILKDLGFKDYTVELRDREYTYQMEEFKKSVMAVSPYVHRLPADMREQFIDDLIEAMINYDLNQKLLNKKDNTFRFIYKQMVINAKKIASV